MEDAENKDRDRGEIFSRIIRAGKRTYFFDVKATAGDDQYITITESKRRFSNEQGKFFYEKHKIFLYKEDFDKFSIGLGDVIEFIRTGHAPDRPEFENELYDHSDAPAPGLKSKSIDFEDLSADH